MIKNKNLFFKIGMSAPEAVIKIVEINPEIGFLLFKIYTSRKNLEEETTRIRTSLNRMIHHNPPQLEKSIWLEREKITIEHLNEIIKTLVKKRTFAVTSKAKLLN